MRRDNSEGRVQNLAYGLQGLEPRKDGPLPIRGSLIRNDPAGLTLGIRDTHQAA